MGGLAAAAVTAAAPLDATLDASGRLDEALRSDYVFHVLFLLAKEAAGVQRSHGVGLLAAAARGGHHGGTREALLTSIGALDAYAEACRAAAPVWVDAVRLDALLRPPADCLELQAMLLEPGQVLWPGLGLELISIFINTYKYHCRPARIKVQAWFIE